MPEDNTVRGIPNRPDLPGPPDAPNPRVITDEDAHIGPLGDPNATSRRYFLETKSTDLRDIVTRTSPSDPVPTIGDD